jgi:inosine-uridine nucleoside N-ribohydrolase
MTRLTLSLAALLMPVAAMSAEKPAAAPIIFDTDMGNDIDDALALALIHALESKGECKLLAVTLTKDNRFAAPMVDAVNTFYGRGSVPIGAVKGGPTRDDGKFNRAIAEASDDGQPRYPHDLRSGDDAPEATGLLRQVLAGQKDGTVVVVQVGFSTNLARLLDSPADEHSPLTGIELVRQKVRLLSLMGGAFARDLIDKKFAEYNIKVDVRSAQALFDRWPTPIVASGFEVGCAIKYPAASIERDYAYVEHHPVAEAYRHYLKMPYDRETWDLTSVLYAVRPDAGDFGLSPAGQIRVNDDGQTPFTEKPDGRHRYLTVTPKQAERVKAEFVKLCSRPPDRLTEAKPAQAPLGIDADFPGGNIIVERVDGDEIYVKQDLRDTEGFWFYWAFRVRGAEGRRLTVHFTNGKVLAARGPAVSVDGGQKWSWLNNMSAGGQGFVYDVPVDAREVRFAFTIPYVQRDLEQWLNKQGNNPHLKVDELCRSKKGRSVERLRLGKLEGEPKHRMLVTCRHHACETMANFAVEGLMDAVLADGDEGRWFRDNVEMLVLPLMDKDGVEQGDQGKNRRPHDHNRDYMGESIYPEVAALKAFVPSWSQGKLSIAFDMHCPYISGGRNEQVFFVGNRYPEVWKRQQEFGRLLQQSQTGPIVYDPKHDIPFGQEWNTGDQPRSNSAWTGSLPGIAIAGTWEVAYASAGGKPVTPDSAREFGRDLARAVRRYLDRP